MKVKVFAVVGIVGICGLAARAEEAAKESAKPAGGPKIQLDRVVYDFGSTSMVQQLAGTFIISNVGDAELVLQKPQPTCGCTVPALKTDKLAPGEKTELNFTLNVGTPRGHVEKHITLPSNDPSEPNIRLTLKADIVPTFDVTPQGVNLGNLSQGTITNVEVEVKRVDGKPVNLTRVETTQSFVRAKLESVEGSKDSVRLRVQVEAEGGPRYFNDSVRLFAGDSTQAAVVVPVNGRVVGDISANPETQFWGIADPDTWPSGRPDQQTRKFSIVVNKPDTKLEIKKATTELPDITVDVKPLEEGKSYEITATLAKAPKQSERGSIKVETNMGNLELGLTVNVLKRS